MSIKVYISKRLATFLFFAVLGLQCILAQPEIEVRGLLIDIVDGGAGTPSALNDTDFGTVTTCAGFTDKVFTINNLGNANLVITAINFTGSNFTLQSGTLPITVPGPGTTTITVRYTASVSGISTETITIVNNDASEANFDFSIRGTANLPEIEVRGLASIVIPGNLSNSPNSTDGSDFVDASVCNSPLTVVRTFTVANTGTANLNVTTASSNNARFSVAALTPASPIAAAGTATFAVTFDPLATGVQNAIITVANSDCNEASYQFNVRGRGVAPTLAVTAGGAIADNDVTTPAVASPRHFGNQSVCGTHTDKVFTITNTGTEASTLSFPALTAPFAYQGVNPTTVAAGGGTATFTIRFNPTARGTFDDVVAITNQQCGGDVSYNFAIRGVGSDANINLVGNGNNITENTAVSSPNHTDFGSTGTCDPNTIVRTFTIQNNGVADPLGITAITPTGAQAADFTIGGVTLPLSIPAGSSSTFTVTFNPSANGSRTTEIRIATDDCDEDNNRFDLDVAGTGAAAEINIQGNGASIVDSDPSPDLADHTDFGTQAVCSGTSSRTFTIQNTDVLTALSVGTVTFSGTNPGDFSVSTAPASSVPANGSTTFVVAFNPTGSGVRSANISIVNGDCDENPYNFAIQGNGTDPEANVLGNAISIVSGDNTPSVTDHSDFGTGAACSPFIDRTYTIQNTGNSPMNVGPATVTPSTEFTIVNQPASSIAALGSSNFTVRYTPSSSPAIHTALVAVVTDDCDEINYRWDVKGETTTEITPPTAICQDITVQLDATGSVTVPGSALDNGSADNCTLGPALIFTSAGTFDCTNISTATLVTITVEDAAGNSDDCAAKAVTVQDTIAPTVSCKNKTVYLSAATGAGQASIVATDIENASFDACGIDTKVAGQTLFTCADVDTNLVTLTITDDNGNDRTCTASVIVLDTVSPDPGCLNISVNLNASGFFAITPAMLNGGSTDNCTLAPLSVSNDTMTCAELGTYVDTLHVPDVNGNSSSCNATITVSDLLAPTAICQNRTVHLDAGGQYNLVASHLDNSSTDNCILGTMTVSKTNFTCANIGTNNVVLTVPDISGNSSTCSAVVTVVDSVKPVARCQNRIVLLGPSGTTTILPTLVDTSSTDACGITIRTLSDSTFTCADAGVNPTILTVTDGSGNSDTCTALVFIQDTGTPNAGCVANDTVYLDINGQDTITLADLNVGSGDACGLDTIYITKTVFSCADIGIVPDTLVIVDNSNNSSECITNIFTIDTIPPVARCFNLVATLPASGSATVFPFYVDDGSSDGCGIASRAINLTTINCASVGPPIPVVLTIIDNSGMTDTCHATITVRDYTLPTAVCNNLSLTLNSSGQVSTTLNAIRASATDVCGIASVTVSDTTFDCSNIGVNPVIMTVTDVNANIRRCTSMVTVTEIVPPNANCFQNRVLAVDSTGNLVVLPADIDNNSSDACGIDTMTIDHSIFDCSNLGPDTLVLTVLDLAGNIDNCTATIDVIDNISPWITCRDTSVSIAANGSFTFQPIDFLTSFQDNCDMGLDSATLSQTVFNCANFGLNTETVTVIDSSGNTTTCTVRITIQGSQLSVNASVTTSFCGYGAACSNSSNGTATVVGTGGCAPYSYAWSNGDTTASVTGLGAGTYFVSITDAGSTVVIDTVEVTAPAPISVTILTATTICLGDSTGDIYISAIGGNACGAHYNFMWSNGDTTRDISNLAVGTYTVTVVDTTGCIATQSATVSSFPVPNPAVSYSALTNTLNCSPAFASYQWSVGGLPIIGETNQTMVPAGTGLYSVAVVDANGCEAASTSIQVTIVGLENTFVTEYGLLLFPNPASAEFKIKVNKPFPHPIKVSISDIYGRTLSSRSLPNMNVEEKFDVSDLAAGTYLVTMESKKFETVTIRLVVQ